MESNRNYDFSNYENYKNHLDSLTYLFNKDVILLNTFIYTYLLKYFQKIEFFLNSDKVKDSYINDLQNKVEALYEIIKNINNKEPFNNSELKKYVEIETNTIKNGIIEKDITITDSIKDENYTYPNNINNQNFINNNEINIIFENVDNIVFDTFLLVNTYDELIEYPYNLVKLKIQISFENLVANIYSSECTLIDKKWNFDINTVIDKEKYLNLKDINKLEITFKKNSTDEKKNTILNYLVNHINLHSLNKEKAIENGLLYIYNELFQIKTVTYYDELHNIINDINYFFYLLYEPDFYNCSIQKVNKICYKKLFDQYSNIMIKSKSIKLNNEMITYLLADSIFLPSYVKRNKFKNLDEHIYSSFSSYSDCSSSIKSAENENTSMKTENTLKQHEMNNKKDEINLMDKNKNKKYYTSEIDKDLNKNKYEMESSSSKEILNYESCEDLNFSSEEKKEKEKEKRRKKKMNNLFYNKNFRNILEKIEKKIEKLNNSVFLRVNYKNLKSGSFVNNNSLEINTLYDALLILKSSTSIYKVLKENKNKDNYLIISKYVNINICFLFEVYVYNKEIIAISQKYLNYYFDFLKKPDIIIDTVNFIKSFYEKNLKNSFPYNNYTFQLYIHTFKKTQKKKIILINARTWLYKNKHPIFTNNFLKHYIYTDKKGIEIKDENYNQKNIYKFISSFSYINTNEEEKKEQFNNNADKNVDIFDFYFYDNILYYCIIKDDSIYKKNHNIYPKDLSYIKEGEIDIDNLVDTMKKENNIQ